MDANILMLTVIIFAVIKIVNYGRWAGQKKNVRGAIGLYLLAVFTVAIPVGVYILNLLR